MSMRSHLLGALLLHKGLQEQTAGDDPIALFSQWYRTAGRWGCFMHNAFTLATADAEGHPTARTLLLKGYGPDGFVFYTHYTSRKGKELAAQPRACLLFHWVKLFRQIRIEGTVEPVSSETSDAYFNSRLRGSQIGAWASHQSHTLDSRNILEARVREAEERFSGQPVSRPEYWGGYRLVPHAIEFWQGRAFRLHDRLIYKRPDPASPWTRTRLYP